MATAIVTNLTPATANPWWVVFRLYQALLEAGWTVAYSSDGTTHGAADNWAAGFASLGGGSYIILTGKGGRQVLFQRSTTSTTAGTIRYSRGGGWGTAGAGATTPPTAPADTQTIRNAVNWFGTAADPVKVNIRAEDVSTGDGDFWVAYSTSTAWTSGGGGYLGFLALEDTAPEDTDPYVWWSPPPSTSAWTYFFNDIRQLLQTDSSGAGIWWRWWKSGGSGEAWKSYSGAALYPGSTGSNPLAWGQAPTFGTSGTEVQPHTAEPVVHHIHVVKSGEASFKDPVGGRVKNLWFANPTEVPNLRTLGGGAYAKLGSWVVVRWNGDPLDPPVEA